MVAEAGGVGVDDSAVHDGTCRPRARTRSRWVVHAWLIVTFVGSLVALALLRDITVHIVAGLVFVALAGLHVAQRRRTVGRLLLGLSRVSSWVRPRARLAWSDIVLALLTLNVFASGLTDWLLGYKALLPLAVIGLPEQLLSWHALSALVLFCYVLVHVVRRWGRLRTSVIR